MLALAIAFFARHALSSGFRDDGLSLLAAAWIVPLLTRTMAGITGIPLGLMVMLALDGMMVRRVLSEGSVRRSTRIAQA